MDQEEQEPPLIKEEQEELCISQGLDQLLVKLMPKGLFSSRPDWMKSSNVLETRQWAVKNR